MLEGYSCHNVMVNEFFDVGDQMVSIAEHVQVPNINRKFETFFYESRNHFISPLHYLDQLYPYPI